MVGCTARRTGALNPLLGASAKLEGGAHSTEVASRENFNIILVSRPNLECPRPVLKINKLKKGYLFIIGFYTNELCET